MNDSNLRILDDSSRLWFQELLQDLKYGVECDVRLGAKFSGVTMQGQTELGGVSTPHRLMSTQPYGEKSLSLTPYRQL